MSLKRHIIKKYPKEDIEIVWDSKKCIHSGICARQLGEVFRPGEQPWIQPEHATKEVIIEQVGRCPSGALSIKKAE